MKWLILHSVILMSLIGYGQVDLAVQKAHSDEIVQLEFSPSGRYLASMANNHEFVVWDLFHGKSISSFDISLIETIQGLKFSQNEKTLKVKTQRTTFSYDIVNETLNQNYETDSTYRRKAYFFDTENRYEVYLKNGTIRKRLAGKKIAKYKIAVTSQKTNFKAFAVSPKANLIVGVADNDLVYVYDYLKGGKKKELNGHFSEVNDVAFSSDGKFFATAGKDRSIIIWDAETLTIKKRLLSNIFRKKTAEFSHDGNQIFVGDELGYVYSIDFSSAFPQIIVGRDNFHAVNKIVKNRENNTYFLATSNNQVCLKSDPVSESTIEEYQFRDHAFLESKSLLIENVFNAYQEPFGEVTRLEQSPDGNTIIFTGESEFPSLNYANVASGKTRRLYHYYNSKPWKDLGFTSDSTFVSVQDSSNVLHFWQINDKKVYTKTDTLKYVLEDFEVIGPNKLWLNTKHYGQFIYDTDTRLSEKVLSQYGLQTIRRKQYLILETYSNTLVFYDLEKGMVYHQFSGHRENVTDLNFHPDGNKFVTSSDDGTVRIWDLSERQSLAIIIPFKNKEFIFITGNNYYLMTKGAMDEIGFKVKEQYFYPEQFDLKYNRPDLVLGQLGFSDNNLIKAYHKAYLKRLKKMKFTEAQVNGEFHLPEAEILNRKAIEAITSEDSVQLELSFKDDKFLLDRINIWINDVAIFGLDGIDVRDRKKNEIKEKLSLELADGKNKIEVSVLNQTGVESYKTRIDIEKTGQKSIPNLYIASIGISKHKDSQYDLEFADKDAEDIVSTFKQHNFFGTVNNLTLTNQDVNRENLMKLRAFLGQAKINDVVLVFIAGHGVLNEDFDYFFATHDMDFDHPSQRGIPYESIEKLLDGIAALKKLLFIDTCHSGELDKDEVEKTDEDTEEQGDIIFRSAGTAVRLKDGPLGLQSTNDLMKSLFTDLRKGTGATVISSSGGAELSIEGNNFKNGLFTYCLLNGLTSGEADLNEDNKIYVSELQRYLQFEVNRLSNGMQTPTSRIQNNELDYQIW